MRNAFAEALYECAMADPRIYIVVADISPVGSMAKFREQYPERFINVGVAEQSMIGICAGLALRGMRPFAYTIAPFALFRPYEFVRDDLCYQNLPVTIVGMGAGAAYASLGCTHQAIEDVGLACALPNMTVLAPCDPLEVTACVNWCASEAKGPVYLRLGKTGEPNIGTDVWEYGKPRFLRYGRKDVLIMTYGPIAKLAFDVGEILDATVISVHTLKPLPIQKLAPEMFFFKRNVVIEEHVYQGGLAQQLRPSYVKSFCLQDRFSHCHGTREEYLADHGLTVEKILWEIGYETRSG